MKNDKQISVLNSLIEINNDRIEGYNTAAKETEEFDFKELFSALAHTSVECNEELEAEVLTLGGKPEEHTRTTGKLFRVWMDFKATITGKDRKGILSSCEQGEDVAVSVYEKVLQEESSDSLSPEQTRMVYGQYQSIKSDHDKVRTLRDMLVDAN